MEWRCKSIAVVPVEAEWLSIIKPKGASVNAKANKSNLISGRQAIDTDINSRSVGRVPTGNSGDWSGNERNFGFRDLSVEAHTGVYSSTGRSVR